MCDVISHTADFWKLTVNVCRLIRRMRAARLIGCIDELHTLVGDGEDDCGDFSHLFS